MSALDSGIRLAEILVCLCRQMFEKIVTTQTCLGQTLKATASVRTDKGTCPCLKLVWVLGGDVILQTLPSRALVGTMLALVLEGTRMLRLDVHVDGALILPHKGAVRALKLTGLGANVFKSHDWGPVFRAGENSIFLPRVKHSSECFRAVSATKLASDFFSICSVKNRIRMYHKYIQVLVEYNIIFLF